MLDVCQIVWFIPLSFLSMSQQGWLGLGSRNHETSMVSADLHGFIVSLNPEFHLLMERPHLHHIPSINMFHLKRYKRTSSYISHPKFYPMSFHPYFPRSFHFPGPKSRSQRPWLRLRRSTRRWSASSAMARMCTRQTWRISPSTWNPSLLGKIREVREVNSPPQELGYFSGSE